MSDWHQFSDFPIVFLAQVFFDLMLFNITYYISTTSCRDLGYYWTWYFDTIFWNSQHSKPSLASPRWGDVVGVVLWARALSCLFLSYSPLPNRKGDLLKNCCSRSLGFQVWSRQSIFHSPSGNRPNTAGSNSYRFKMPLLLNICLHFRDGMSKKMNKLKLWMYYVNKKLLSSKRELVEYTVVDNTHLFCFNFCERLEPESSKICLLHFYHNNKLRVWLYDGS